MTATLTARKMGCLSNGCQFLLLCLFIFLEPQVARSQGLYVTTYSNSKCTNPAPGILPIPPGGPFGAFCVSGSLGNPVKLTGPGFKTQSFTSFLVECSPVPSFTAHNNGDCQGAPINLFRGPNGDVRGYCAQVPGSGTSYRFFCTPPQQTCLPALRIKRKACQRRIKQCGSAPYTGLKWTEACRAKGKPVQPAGCRCREYCAYNCKRRCTKDKDCVWNTNLNACAHKATPDSPAESGCRSWY